jgi:hypothetical protein
MLVILTNDFSNFLIIGIKLRFAKKLIIERDKLRFLFYKQLHFSNTFFIKYKMNNTRRDEMTNYLISQKPRVIERFSNKLEMIKFKGKENFEDLPFISLTGSQKYGVSENTDGTDKINDYLRYQTPTVMTREVAVLTGANMIENFTEEILIPPLNTDIRFSAELPEHDVALDLHEYSQTHPYITTLEDSNSYRPREYDYNHRHKKHPFGKYIYDEIQENFSWALPTADDTVLDLVKKSLIHEVSSQHACGSCWYLLFFVNNSLFFIIKKI